MLEQAGVGNLSDCEVEHDVVQRDVETFGECGDVLRNQNRAQLVFEDAIEEWNSDVTARENLTGQLADDLAELQRKQRATESPQGGKCAGCRGRFAFGDAVTQGALTGG